MKQSKYLLILAAGQGSRYGGNKQTEGFGPFNEMIMDYSIYDAIRAGFDNVVFVIRKDFFQNFKNIIENRWKNKINIHYTFQEKENFCTHPNEFANREKPWGTGHAILCASHIIKQPFLMINADDFYGSSSFQIASNFLETKCLENQFGIIAYQLSQTISKHGSVSRGICKTDNLNFLINIKEHTKIFCQENNILSEIDHTIQNLNPNEKVSMNFFCFHPSIFSNLKKGFQDFLKTDFIANPAKAEFLISNFIDFLMKHQNLKVLVENTPEKWFGVTYKEDAQSVRAEIQNLINNNIYPNKL